MPNSPPPPLRLEHPIPFIPGLRGLLGIRLPVDVPVAPCSASDESYRLCITLPHTLYQTFVINIINNIRIRFIISFYVICAVIHCLFCCIYVWLDLGTYMIARFMFFYKPGVTIAQLYSCLLSQLGPAVMERTVAKNRYGILDVAFSKKRQINHRMAHVIGFKIRNNIKMTERIKSKSNCSTERPIVQKFIMFLHSKILDSLTQISHGLSSR